MSTLPIVRHDSLPEGVEPFSYVPDGCEVSRSCFDCPLAECKHDDPGNYAKDRMEKRNAMIWRWRKEGMHFSQIARALKVSSRTVHRVLQAGAPSERPPEEGQMYQTSSNGAVKRLRARYIENRATTPLRPSVSKSRVIYERG